MLHNDHEITERRKSSKTYTCSGQVLQAGENSTNVNYFMNRKKRLVLSKYDLNPCSLQIGGTFLTGDIMNKMILSYVSL